MNMLMNFLSQVGKIKRDGKKTHACFYLDKMKEDDVGKNKSTTPTLAFPFALVLNKTCSFSKKAYMHFGGSRINKTC